MFPARGISVSLHILTSLGLQHVFYNLAHPQFLFFRSPHNINNTNHINRIRCRYFANTILLLTTHTLPRALRALQSYSLYFSGKFLLLGSLSFNPSCFGCPSFDLLCASNLPFPLPPHSHSHSHQRKNYTSCRHLILSRFFILTLSFGLIERESYLAFESLLHHAAP